MHASIYVSHRSSDVELAARLVDLLELAFELPAGSLGCSALPGYAPSGPREQALRALMEHAQVVLVPLTDPFEPEQLVELGALWAAGRWIVALEADEDGLLRLPPPLDGIKPVSLPERGAFAELLEDIGYALGVVVRVGRVSQAQVAELCGLWPGGSAAATRVGDLSWALAASRRETPIEEPAPELARSQAAPTAPAPAPSAPPRAQSVPPRAQSAPPMASRVQSVPPRAQSVPPPPPRRSAPIPAPNPPRRAVPPDDDFEVVDASALDPVLEASCELSLRAGRAISDCAFHGLEGRAIDPELDASFGRFLDAVGGSWQQLRNLADPELWLEVTDNLLEGLPPEQRHLSSWYELGFQLATLHNLATEEVPDDAEALRVYQEAFHDALGAFRQSAAAARLSYDDVAELEGLLRGLAGPATQRDYSGISLSLAQLSFHAEQADQAHAFG